ncbi:kynureninase [Streptomyces lavendulae]|uniref:kynureninase n=1 Tax=Streptomyces lavendulae TaxID=1914 RepID=UPI0033EC0324
MPTPSRETAERLDRNDPLAAVRTRYSLPSGVVYLDGNSLGALSAGVSAAVQTAIVEKWGQHLIDVWTDDGWWQAPLRVGDRVGRLLGAQSGQTVVGDSTSVHLFNALTAAARLRPDRRLLLVEEGGFPTNNYLAASVARILGLEVRPVAMSDIASALRRLGERVAVVTAGAVDFRTGELWDVRAVTEAAHDVGALAVWDLCHAVGALPLTLDADGVDFAVGCSYKFLSGGPGAPGFVYAARRHHGDIDQPLCGWHGHAEPFAMVPDYKPVTGIGRLRVGSPSILSMLALDAALDVFDDVDMAAVREKNVALGRFFIEAVDAHLAGRGFELVTPRRGDQRGSQVTLCHPEAERIMRALHKQRIIGDLRPPGLLRFGFNSLYTSYTDIFAVVEALRSCT